MTNRFEEKNRNLLPNWRSFEDTLSLGELNESKDSKLISSLKLDISDLTDEWENYQNIGLAGDILGAAMMGNRTDEYIVKNAARFILSNQLISSKALVDMANKVLTQNDSIKKDFIFENSATNINPLDSSLIKVQIATLKKKLVDNPSNPINWIEIARNYSILGQIVKAERSIKNALALSPENRFVLRSAARHFANIGDFEFAHDILRKSDLTKHDPWLMASEIAFATIRDRGSKFFKHGVKIVENSNFHPFNFSELAGSLATLELKNSSLKQSKKLFKSSLLCPNDNALAQAEWASQNELKLEPVEPKKFSINNSFEALARDSVEKTEWKDAFQYSQMWFFDQPFLIEPIFFGNTIAIKKLKNHTLAAEIAKLGLISHQNDMHLINNLAYSLLEVGNIEEAENLINRFNKFDFQIINPPSICLTATKGMLLFRKGDAEKGKEFYSKAIQMAKESKDIGLQQLAFAHYIREEVLLGKNDTAFYLPILNNIAKEGVIEDAKDIANEVVILIERSKKD